TSCASEPACRSLAMTARPIIPAQAVEETGHVVVAFDDNRLVPELFGEFDQNLALLEQRLGVDAAARGHQGNLRGSTGAMTRARIALDMLYGRLQEGHSLA